MPKIVRPDPAEELEETASLSTGEADVFSPDSATDKHLDDLDYAEMVDDSSSDYWQEEKRKREERHASLVTELDQPIPAELLKQRKAFDEGSKVLTYAEWHTIVRRLNKFFGHDGWTTQVVSTKSVGEDHKTGVPLHVTSTVILKVRWPNGGTSTFTNVGTNVTRGAKVWSNGRPVLDEDGQPVRRYTWSAYDMSVKASVHDGIKRCATALGDAFGLGLYDDDADTSEGETTDTAVETKAPTPIRKPKAEYPIATEDDEVAECEECGKEIKGYTNRQGRTYTTADLVGLSQRKTGGRTLCYDHQQKYAK